MRPARPAGRREARQDLRGKRISVNEIAWEERGAVLTFPLPGEKSAHGVREAKSNMCGSERVCLYQHRDYGGRKLSFYKCKFQKLRWYDFTNKTSSWYNNQTHGARSVLDYWDGNSVETLQSTTAPSSYLYVGGANNDRSGFLEVC